MPKVQLELSFAKEILKKGRKPLNPKAIVGAHIQRKKGMKKWGHCLVGLVLKLI